MSCVMALDKKRRKKMLRDVIDIAEGRLVLLSTKYDLCPNCALQVILTAEMRALKASVEGVSSETVLHIMMKSFTAVYGGEWMVSPVTTEPAPKVH